MLIRQIDPETKLQPNTLTELRKKEDELRRDMADGIDYAAGEIAVSELVDRYMNLKRDLSENTRRAYGTVINRIKEAPFGQMKVRTVKLSDAKAFYIGLHDSGNKRNTITIFHSVLRPSFEMAVDDDMIRKNPFKFQVADILQNDAEKRTSLTKAQQEAYLKYVQEYGQDNYYQRCSDDPHDRYGLSRLETSNEESTGRQIGADHRRVRRLPVFGQVGYAQGRYALGELHAWDSKEDQSNLWGFVPSCDPSCPAAYFLYQYAAGGH